MASANMMASKASGLDQPLIYPGKVLHTRLFPQHHSFAYPFLMVWIPVHRLDRGNAILSVDVGANSAAGWLQVRAQDHLHREDNECGIKHKLGVYLRKEGISLNDYPFVYLVTAPRVLNHKFSPASFWFLYSADHTLEIMIAEVNNTFDERRMYIRHTGSVAVDANVEVPSCPPSMDFQSFWPKDFHVSPFSSRKGYYHMQAKNPCLGSEPSDSSKSCYPSIDIRPILYSSKGHKKVYTRLWSTAQPLDPAKTSWWSFTMFMLSWFWVGRITFPRIVYQAIQLAHRRGLSIWYLPEPRDTTVPRQATSSEKTLSNVFSKYIRARLCAHKGVAFKSHNKTNGSAEYHFELTDNNTADARELTINITAPNFYSRFASYITLDSFLTTELSAPAAEENLTIRSSSPTRLVCLLREECPACETSLPSTASNSSVSGRFVRFEWFLLELLRFSQPLTAGWYPGPGNPHRRAAAGSGNDSSADPVKARAVSKSAQPWRTTTFLDAWMQQHGTAPEQSQYRRAMLRVAIERRLAAAAMLVLSQPSWMLVALTAIIVWYFGVAGNYQGFARLLSTSIMAP